MTYPSASKTYSNIRKILEDCLEGKISDDVKKIIEEISTCKT
jgi:hypothetical protein